MEHHRSDVELEGRVVTREYGSHPVYTYPGESTTGHGEPCFRGNRHTTVLNVNTKKQPCKSQRDYLSNMQKSLFHTYILNTRSPFLKFMFNMLPYQFADASKQLFPYTCTSSHICYNRYFFEITAGILKRQTSNSSPFKGIVLFNSLAEIKWGYSGNTSFEDKTNKQKTHHSHFLDLEVLR